MANSQSSTLNPSAASVPTLVCVHDSLQEVSDGLDALMYFSVSEHLDAKTQSALNFLYFGLNRAAGEAKTALEAMMEAQEKAASSAT